MAPGGGESSGERYRGHREQEHAIADVDHTVSNRADAEHQPLDHVSQWSHRRRCQRRSRSLSGGCILYLFQVLTNARPPHVLKMYTHKVVSRCLGYLRRSNVCLACPKENISTVTPLYTYRNSSIERRIIPLVKPWENP